MILKEKHGKMILSHGVLQVQLPRKLKNTLMGVLRQTTTDIHITAKKKLLYLSLVSHIYNDITISSEAEYIEYVKKEHEAIGHEFNARDMVDAKSQAKDWFEILRIYEYSIGADSSSLTLKEYFSGSLPTFIKFKDSGYDPTSSTSVNLTLDGSELKIKSTSDNSKTYIFLNYNNGSFSGTAVTEGTILEPTVTGTYSVSGTGISDSIVTLKFTALPTKITEISNLRTNTEYQLKQTNPNKTSITCTLSN